MFSFAQNHHMKRIPRLVLILVLIFANIGCDQITKKLAREQIKEYETIEVIGEYLILTKTENTGAFLGMGSDFPPIVRTLLLLILPILVMVGVFIYLLRTNDLSQINVIGLSFIVGGGIGNLYDRILYGSVTDMVFIDLQFAHTGIFNLADVSVMVGTGLIIIDQFVLNRNPKKPGKASA